MIVGNIIKINKSSYLILASLLMLVGLPQNFQKQNLDCEIEVASPRTLISSTTELTGIWGADFDIDQVYTDTFVATSTQLIASKSCGEVISFDIRTGEVVWRVDEVINPTDLTLDLNNNSVYVVGQQEIRALSLLDGETQWNNTSQLFSRAAISTYLLSSGELIVDVVGRGMYLLDNNTGTLGDQISLPSSTSFYDGNVVLTKDVGNLTLIEVSTGAEMWSYSDIGGSWEFEVFEDDDLITIRWLDSEPRQGMIGLQLSTGELLWEWSEDQLASRPTTVDGIVGFLTLDAELIQLDTVSGSQVNRILFNKTDEDHTLQNSQILFNDNVIGVYFQDQNTFSVYGIVT